MKTKLLTLAVLLALLLTGVSLTGAQTRPTIITFESSLETITLTEVEAGAASTTLSWHTAGVTEEYMLVLHYFVLDGWELAFSPEGVPLDVNGERVVTIRHPLTFSPPTYLLSIVRRDSNAIIDQRTLAIPYMIPADTTVEINSLEADVAEIDATALEAGNALIELTWDVAYRPPTANLFFEQVMADQSAVLVEMPRVYWWIPSVAEGPVAPVYEPGAEAITVRLRVVDVLTEEIYAEELLEIPVAGAPPAPSVSEPAAGGETTTPPEPEIAQPSPKVVVFTATPETVNPGAPITLTWDVLGVENVIIEASVPNASEPPETVQTQSVKGTIDVFTPEEAAYSVTYTLKSPDGTTLSEATVNVHCPFTFFFGTADGCPLSNATEVGAVYQPFENGAMIWRSDTNEIYVHFADGTARQFSPVDYGTLPDPTLETMPPLDRQAPSAGFGKVWASDPTIKEQLGWAVDSETGYYATVQAVALSRDPRPTVAVYFTLPDESIVGTGFGMWEAVP